MNINLTKASKLVNAGKYDKAEKIVKSERRKDPQNISLMNFLASIYMSTKRHALAAELMSAIHKRKEPKATSFYINYVVTLRNLKLFDDAIVIADEGLAKDPSSLELLIEKASSLRRIGRSELARELLNKAISINPNCRAWTALGNLEYDLGNYERSLSCFKTSQDNGHLSQSTMVGLVRVYYQMEDFDMVINSYLKFKQHLTNHYNNELFNYAMTCVAHVEKDKASKFLSELLSMREGFTDELVNFHSTLIAPIFFRSKNEISEFRQQYLEKLSSCEPLSSAVSPENFRPKHHLYLAYHGDNDLDINLSLAGLFPDSQIKARTQSNSGSTGKDRVKLAVVTEHFNTDHVIYRLFNQIFVRLASDGFDIEIFHIKKESDRNLSSGEVIRTTLPKGNTRTFKFTNFKMLLKELTKAAPDILFFPEVGEGSITYGIAHHRIAKSQVTSWGFPQSTGLATIDYFISSKSMETEGSPDYYSEQLVQLNNLPCFL